MERSRDLTVRTHPLLLGVLIFLASELMFFGGMLTAYYNLRTINTPWPPPDVHLDVVESSIGTLLLGLSSGTMFATTQLLARRRFGLARVALGATICCAIVFLALTLHGWSANAFHINSHAYGSVFYMLTGFHALHVAIGIALLAALLIGIDAAAFERDDRAGAESIGLYWHFVFGVWVLIWGTIYFIR